MDETFKKNVEALKARAEGKTAKGKTDPYMSRTNPKAAVGLSVGLVYKLLGDDAFEDATPGGFVKQSSEDRVLVDLGRTLKNGIDAMEIRTSEFPNLVTVTFMKGGQEAQEAKKNYQWAQENGHDYNAALAEFKAKLGAIPEHRNVSGFYAVSAFHGVLIGEVIDLLRTQTGLEITPDAEWDKSRVEYNAHVQTCDCESCRDTMKNRDTLRKHYPELRPEGENVTPFNAASATVRVVTIEDFTGDDAMAKAVKRSLEVVGNSSVN
jgi:hypothetical protein